MKLAGDMTLLGDGLTATQRAEARLHASVAPGPEDGAYGQRICKIVSMNT